ncbi:hypothetical protein BZA05DRAFT_402270 [Tricharina praecox]|uniref:uncharacterized protein n=1 Tax=Tricharina praecox TaxID=43433 RepID=UPI002220C1F2|nr:uncharacterized protein BZA05DRAFT_402270 [Tricharina praecox]KAI5849126.1 hypothetical protein BZA05DRAFT_402270 [Tricharina praecox]
MLRNLTRTLFTTTPPLNLRRMASSNSTSTSASTPISMGSSNTTPASSTSFSTTPTGEKLIFAPADGQYTRGTLSTADLSSSPFTQFHGWFSAAQSASVYQPETLVLSTASLPSGRVSARTVYLKELDPTGFVIYSNFGTSRKSQDLRGNPWASLTFYWREMERQVRVEGVTERLVPEESQRYFDTRIRGSRIGAWASRQSEVIEHRSTLEERVSEVEKRFEGQEKIPVPEFWGGLRVRPVYVEFWQGRESRLHDRFVYERESVDSEVWTVKRLSP